MKTQLITISLILSSILAGVYIIYITAILLTQPYIVCVAGITYEHTQFTTSNITMIRLYDSEGFPLKCNQ